MAEVDYCPTSDHLFLGTDKVAQLKRAGIDPYLDHIFSPHLHVLLDTGGASTANLLNLLERKWPSQKAIDLRPITSPIDQSIEHLVYYITKFDERRTINRQGWENENFTQVLKPDDDVTCRMYSYFNSQRNFKLLKIKVSPVRDKTVAENIQSHEENVIGDEWMDDEEPLPFIM